MTSRNSNRKSSQRRSEVDVLRQEVSALKVNVFGHQFRPTPDPTSVTRRPWNSITLVSILSVVNGGDTPIDYTVTTIQNQLNTQLGISTPTSGYIFRLQWAQVWGLVGGSLTMVFRDVNSLTLYAGDDTGDGTHRSKLGYRWPERVSALPINTTSYSSAKLLSLNFNSYPGASTGPAESVGTLHLHVLWRTAD